MQIFRDAEYEVMASAYAAREREHAERSMEKRPHTDKAETAFFNAIVKVSGVGRHVLVA